MDKEAWKDNVLNSLKGIQKAIPREGLLADIEQQINADATAIISIHQWRFAAAAAIILFVANFWTVQQLVDTPATDSKEIVRNEVQGLPALISNYKLYD